MKLPDKPHPLKVYKDGELIGTAMVTFLPGDGPEIISIAWAITPENVAKMFDKTIEIKDDSETTVTTWPLFEASSLPPGKAIDIFKQVFRPEEEE